MALDEDYKRPGLTGVVAQQSKEDLTMLIDSTTSVAALTDPVIALAALPTTGCMPTGDAQCAKVTFGGTNAENEDYTYQVALFRYAGGIDGVAATPYLPDVVARGTVTLGAATYTDATATHYLADTITNDLPAHPGVRVHSPGGDEVASIVIDVNNAAGLWAQVDCNAGSEACASADVMVQLGESPFPFELIPLVGDIDDATTDSLHGKIGTDTEMGDRSLYDMLGGIDAATTDSINGKIGTDTEMGDASLYDMLGGFSGDGGADSDDSAKAATDILIGLLGDMEHVTSTALLANTNTGTITIFNFTGQIEVLRITGIVKTTAMEARETILKLVYNPDASGDEDLCIGLDVTGDDVGTFYEIDGTAANAMIATGPGVVPVACQQTANMHLACHTAGTIAVNNVDIANAGRVYWSITWRPLSENATVAAA